MLPRPSTNWLVLFVNKMSEKELLLKISTIVCQELGEDFEEEKAENLVFRLSQAFLENTPTRQEYKNETSNCVITFYGRNGEDVLEKIKEILKNFNCRISNLSQSFFEERFILTLIVKADGKRFSVRELQKNLERIDEQSEVKIYFESEEL